MFPLHPLFTRINRRCERNQWLGQSPPKSAAAHGL